MKKIDMSSVPILEGADYPAPYDHRFKGQKSWRLGVGSGISQFGVNLTHLEPETWFSQRHWHSAEDEFVYVLKGEVVLVSDTGEELLREGDYIGFKAGLADGHHLQNRSREEAVILEIGTHAPHIDRVEYPDIDLALFDKAKGFSHKDGSPYVVKPPWWVFWK